MPSSAAVFTTLLLLTVLPAQADEAPERQVLTRFSAITSLDDGWAPLEFPSIDQYSHYTLVDEDGVQVVRAETDGGASGLIARVSIVAGSTRPVMRAKSPEMTILPASTLPFSLIRTVPVSLSVPNAKQQSYCMAMPCPVTR